MASLKKEARRWFEDFQEGIAWMLVWKTGRSWNITRLYDTEYTEGSSYHQRPSKWELSRDDAEKIVAAMEDVPHAMLINGYYNNIGTMEDMTLSSLIDGLKFQYDFDGRISDDVLAVVNAVLEATDEDSQEDSLDSSEDSQEDHGMLARAMAKAAHEAEMLDGSDPLVVEVVNPFQVPEFILPDPIDFHLSLCDQVDGILRG